jgi:tRNA(Ile)-lysidine synthase
MIEKKFDELVENGTLWKEDDTFLLAVSGGIDSIVMADLFHRSKLRFAIAHCNFQLRGREAFEDEKFVERLARKHSATFFSVRFDTKKFSKENKLSTQEAARKLRYDWFKEICERQNIDFIAMAHHLDDSIETFFINLLRGTGIDGLKGIPRKNGNVVRPLIYFTRAEILAYANKRKLKYREDSSNKEEVYLRNKIRLKLFPVIEKINPKFRETLQKTMQNVELPLDIFSREVKKTFSHLFEEEGNKSLIAPINQIKMLQEPEQYLYYLLRPMGFNAETAREVLQPHQSGKRFYSDTQVLTIDRDSIIIETKTPLAPEGGIIEEGQKNFTCNNIKLDFSYLLLTAPNHNKIPMEKNVHWLDAGLLKFPLHIRQWKKGDYFMPLGMKGRKKLSDYLIDAKISLSEKEKTCVILSGKQIACILGQRIDDRFKVTDKTRKILCVEVK